LIQCQTRARPDRFLFYIDLTQRNNVSSIDQKPLALGPSSAV